MQITNRQNIHCRDHCLYGTRHTVGQDRLYRFNLLIANTFMDRSVPYRRRQRPLKKARTCRAATRSFATRVGASATTGASRTPIPTRHSNAARDEASLNARPETLC
jgi:hypothetical protein